MILVTQLANIKNYINQSPWTNQPQTTTTFLSILAWKYLRRIQCRKRKPNDPEDKMDTYHNTINPHYKIAVATNTNRLNF